MSSNNHLILLREFTQREIVNSYRKTFLGIVWIFLLPALTWAVYAFVFIEIIDIESRSPALQSQNDYLMSLFLGLIIFLFFSEVVAASPNYISGKPSFVKKVKIPIYVLVLSRVFASSVSLIVSTVLLFAVNGYLKGGVEPQLIFLPFVILVIIWFTFGVGLVLACFGVYVPDLAQLVRPLTRLIFYATPIVYPLSLVPPEYQSALWLNPMTSMVELTRGFLNASQQFDYQLFVNFVVVTVVVFTVAIGIYKKLKVGFADVI